MRYIPLSWLYGFKSSPARFALMLGAVGLTLGLLIVAGYYGAISLIAAHRMNTLRQQVAQVLPGATLLQQLHYSNSTWQPVALGSDGGDYLYAGYDEAGRFMGYAIPGEGPGYQDTIRLLYGYQAKQDRIVGITILDSGETSGWGDKVMEDEVFLSNFRDLAIDPRIVVVDRGEKKQPNEVDMVTGATISSQAIVRILNATNRLWLKRLPAIGEDLPLVIDR